MHNQGVKRVGIASVRDELPQIPLRTPVKAAVACRILTLVTPLVPVLTKLGKLERMTHLFPKPMKPNMLLAILGWFLMSAYGNAQSLSESGAAADRIVRAAESQIGITTTYDPSYQQLDYPNGDIDRSGGVCTDVVIRAFRDAFGYDLQQAVHKDMKAHFSAYPKNWGLNSTDRNIDHRRVLNLRRFFERQGIDLPVATDAAGYLPRDVVSWDLGGGLTHIGVVSDALTSNGIPLIIHNIGSGTKQEDILFQYSITGHFRPALSQIYQ